MNMDPSAMTFVVRADRPFNGSVQAVLNDDVVMYTGGMSFDDYAASLDFPVKRVSQAEMSRMIREYVDVHFAGGSA